MAANTKARILIAEDDPSICRLLTHLLSREADVDIAEDGKQATERLSRTPYDLVVSDLYMPNLDGLALLRWVRAFDADIPVLVLTAHSSVQTAIEAIQLGAFDYLEKPIDHDRLRTAVRNALSQRRLQLRARLFDAPPPEALWNGLLGRCDAMRWVYQLTERVARYPTPVLITGESGTGKELIARAVHACSDRARGPFVALNSASIVESLFESTLFGHKKGSFTGALRDQRGLFEQADGGTLFLDEIGEMALTGQAKLLRVLETLEIQPVGAGRPRRVDVRIVSATNRHLLDAIEAGDFRRDLYYRLCGVNIQLPALRDRGSDVRALAEHFLARLRERIPQLSATGFAPAVIDVFQRYPWPGNVRELRQVVESTAVICQEPLISPHHLPPPLRATGVPFPAPRPSPARPAEQPSPPPSPTPAPAPAPATPVAPPPPPEEDSLRLTLREVEHRHVARVLADCGQNRSETARRLGVSRHALYRLLRKHELE